MAIVKLAPNLPAIVDVKYADIVTGKYGAQLRFKGKIGDDDNGMLYVDAESVLAQLVGLGALKSVPAFDETALPEKGISVTLTKKRFQITQSQAAGQKHPTTVLTIPGVAAADAPAPVVATSPVAPANGAPPASETKAALYKRITLYALEQIVPLYAAREIPITMEGTAAIVATMWIQANK